MSEKTPKHKPDNCWEITSLQRLLEQEGYSAETGHREGVTYTEVYSQQLEESKQPGKILQITTIINSRPVVYRFQYSPDPDDPDNEEWNPLGGFPPVLSKVFIPRGEYSGAYLFSRDDEMESLLYYCAQHGISVEVIGK